ncbi:hypothetical protein CPter91_2120 [Collimonas pratensis]|uniref:Uncharacterized protein n=1 Tax=Collimonas pratensis TaxID=279113 RepID=A0A127Q332_9BURK|nr:hypothetical protein CPter91_2120 [Collimonas pratensis]
MVDLRQFYREILPLTAGWRVWAGARGWTIDTAWNSQVHYVDFWQRYVWQHSPLEKSPARAKRRSLEI